LLLSDSLGGSTLSRARSCGRERGDEAFVEAEEVFDAVAVAGEWSSAVEFIDGVVEFAALRQTR